MDIELKKQIRRRMARSLTAIGDALADMSSMWEHHDLEPDFLADDEYPFSMSLEDQLAEVRHAVARIEEINDFLDMVPITITVSAREFAELEELLRREPKELPKLRKLISDAGVDFEA